VLLFVGIFSFLVKKKKPSLKNKINASCPLLSFKSVKSYQPITFCKCYTMVLFKFVSFCIFRSFSLNVISSQPNCFQNIFCFCCCCCCCCCWLIPTSTYILCTGRQEDHVITSSLTMMKEPELDVFKSCKFILQSE
jgi:hypothetical protein